MTNSTATAHAGDVQIRRVFDAPRSLVFAAFAQEEHLLKWFGPRAYPVVSWKHDFVPGGAFTYEMRGPGGESAPGAGEYVEIVEDEKIVSLSRITGENGSVIFEVRQTMSFADVGGKTELTLEYKVVRNEGFPGADGAAQGWSETLDRLAEHLAEQVSGTDAKQNA